MMESGPLVDWVEEQMQADLARKVRRFNEIEGAERHLFLSMHDSWRWGASWKSWASSGRGSKGVDHSGGLGVRARSDSICSSTFLAVAMNFSAHTAQ